MLNLVFGTWPADGLVPPCARTSTGSLITQSVSPVYRSRCLKNRVAISTHMAVSCLVFLCFWHNWKPMHCLFFRCSTWIKVKWWSDVLSSRACYDMNVMHVTRPSLRTCLLSCPTVTWNAIPQALLHKGKTKGRNTTIKSPDVTVRKNWAI